MIDKFPVPILQDLWEFNKFLYMYQKFQPKAVLEIGSFYGATLWAWVRYNANLETLISIDYPIPPSDGRYQEMIESRAKWKDWTKHIEFHDVSEDSHAHSTFDRVDNILKDRELDMLFIDGDHTYNGVKKDWLDYKDFVREGGWIVFHDTMGIQDVNRLWNEIKNERKYKTIDISSTKDGWGIGVLEYEK